MLSLHEINMQDQNELYRLHVFDQAVLNEQQKLVDVDFRIKHKMNNSEQIEIRINKIMINTSRRAQSHMVRSRTEIPTINHDHENDTSSNNLEINIRRKRSGSGLGKLSPMKNMLKISSKKRKNSVSTRNISSPLLVSERFKDSDIDFNTIPVSTYNAIDNNLKYHNKINMGIMDFEYHDIDFYEDYNLFGNVTESIQS
eukprot:TRINITY_DN1748_c0_g3_i1.p1 TRINITY_DN1748_c0_g3~~TRINITY_DN1748_c0_g3_i1.p1  ORF type:complete len:199 (-),score=37.41 TRINITY_DN1748_c0_g3_i1:22-618(-)